MVGQEGLLEHFHFGFEFWPVSFAKNQNFTGFLFMLGRF